METKPGASPHCGMKAAPASAASSLHAARARDVLGQVEIVGTGRARRFGDDRGEMEGGGIEHRELAVQQIDQVRAVLHIRSREANAFVRVEPRKNLRGAIGERDLVIARGGQQPGDGSAYFPGADHDDVLHAPSGGLTDRRLDRRQRA